MLNLRHLTRIVLCSIRKKYVWLLSHKKQVLKYYKSIYTILKKIMYNVNNTSRTERICFYSVYLPGMGCFLTCKTLLTFKRQKCIIYVLVIFTVFYQVWFKNIKMFTFEKLCLLLSSRKKVFNPHNL